jgi:tRNA pseudouridine38-40 synthase
MSLPVPAYYYLCQVTAKQRYFIELAYDGTKYHGWQIQQNAVSVQELLNKAIATIWRQPIETTGCGRTDTGVHAREFFAHFDVIDHSPLTMDNGEVNSHGLLILDYGQKIRGLNSLLPADIAIKNIIPVHEDAHARFDATQRSYQYHIIP